MQKHNTGSCELNRAGGGNTRTESSFRSLSAERKRLFLRELENDLSPSYQKQILGRVGESFTVGDTEAVLSSFAKVFSFSKRQLHPRCKRERYHRSLQAIVDSNMYAALICTAFLNSNITPK